MWDVAESELGPDPGWVPVVVAEDVENRSFVSGDPYGDRLRVRYYTDERTGQRAAKVWFGPRAEGPPGHAHGGSIAAVLDEAMGGNCWAQGHPVVAGTLEVVYRGPVPLGAVLRVRTEIAEVDGRKIHTRGSLEGAGGVELASSRGVFVRVREALLDSFREARASGRYRLPDAS
jgi:acyl-coenzyme A thioesterase PaaI-like protein